MNEKDFHNIIDIFEHMNIKGKLRLLRLNKRIRNFLIAHYGDNLNTMLNNEKDEYMRQRQYILELMNKPRPTIYDILTILDIIKQQDMNINSLVNNNGLNILMISLNTYRRQLPNLPSPRDLVQHILSLGIDVNAQTNLLGKTALMQAVGHPISIIKMLLDAGADPFIETNMGRNALYYMSDFYDRRSYEELEKMFAEYKKN